MFHSILDTQQLRELQFMSIKQFHNKFNHYLRDWRNNQKIALKYNEKDKDKYNYKDKITIMDMGKGKGMGKQGKQDILKKVYIYRKNKI